MPYAIFPTMLSVTCRSFQLCTLNIKSKCQVVSKDKTTHYSETMEDLNFSHMQSVLNFYCN